MTEVPTHTGARLDAEQRPDEEGRPLRDRFAELERRIDELENEVRTTTGGDHSIAEVIEDLKGRRADARHRIEPGDQPGQRPPSPGTGEVTDVGEQTYRNLHDAYRAALVRFRGRG